MVSPAPMSYVVECFWSGVRQEDLLDLNRRIMAAMTDLAAGADESAYRGSILVLDDEVVLCLFDGPLATVRRVVERAGVPYERILRATRAPV
jgi:hypothetical protein